MIQFICCDKRELSLRPFITSDNFVLLFIQHCCCISGVNAVCVCSAAYIYIYIYVVDCAIRNVVPCTDRVIVALAIARNV